MADNHAESGAAAAARITDDAAFAAAFRASSRVLWCVAASVLGSASEAEDVVQEAAVIALGKREQLPDVVNFTSWMAQIVRFVALNRRRASGGRAVSTPEFDRQPARRHEPDAVDDSGRLLPNQRAFDDRTNAALMQLEETARACLLLRVVLELSYREISAVLGIPEGTAMSHVFRARRVMLEQLAPADPAAQSQEAAP